MSNELVELLCDLEWSGRASGYAESFAVCPVCKGVRPGQPHAHVYFMERAIGHKDGCRLESAAASLEAQEPVVTVVRHEYTDGNHPENGFSNADWARIESLEPGTKLYRHPPTVTSAVPDGWLVTAETEDDGVRGYVIGPRSDPGVATSVWEDSTDVLDRFVFAMLAAAPQQGGGDDE